MNNPESPINIPAEEGQKPDANIESESVTHVDSDGSEVEAEQQE